MYKWYIRNPEKTKKDIDKDEWLHSGDIAMIILEHGNAMRILNNAKNLFKLQQKQYISPEKF